MYITRFPRMRDAHREPLTQKEIFFVKLRMLFALVSANYVAPRHRRRCCNARWKDNSKMGGIKSFILQDDTQKDRQQDRYQAGNIVGMLGHQQFGSRQSGASELNPRLRPPPPPPCLFWLPPNDLKKFACYKLKKVALSRI